MDDVYVVEIAATGPKGAPEDAVAEIAVCRMLSDGSDFDLVYNDGVAMDPRDLGKAPLDYMEETYGMTPEDLYAGSPEGRVTEDFRKLLYGRECTSFNVGATFGRFLSFEPWDAAREVTLLPSVSARLPADLGGRDPASIRIAYEALCPGDPADVGNGRRAIHLAQMTASVLMLLRRSGMLRSQPDLHCDVPE